MLFLPKIAIFEPWKHMNFDIKALKFLHTREVAQGYQVRSGGAGAETVCHPLYV